MTRFFLVRQYSTCFCLSIPTSSDGRLDDATGLAQWFGCLRQKYRRFDLRRALQWAARVRQVPSPAAALDITHLALSPKRNRQAADNTMLLNVLTASPTRAFDFILPHLAHIYFFTYSMYCVIYSTSPMSRCERLCRLCIVQIQLEKHVLDRACEL